MKNAKTAMTAASVLGTVLAATALTGCTSTSSTTAAGDTSSATASTSASTTSPSTTTTATAATAAATATTANANPGAGSCTGAQLRITETSTGAASLHTGWIVVFTNTGSASCTIEGYPGAGVTDTPGQVVLNATRQQVGFIGGQYPTPAPIKLAPGQSASTVLEWVDAPDNGQAPVGANCPGMDSGKVLITPPDTTRSTAFPAPADLCTAFKVHPVVAGTSGRAS